MTLSPDATMLLDETRWIVTDLLEHLDLLLAVLLPVNHIVLRGLLLEALEQSVVLLSYPIQLSLPLVPIQRLAPAIGCPVRAAHVAVAAHLTEPLVNGNLLRRKARAEEWLGRHDVGHLLEEQAVSLLDLRAAIYTLVSANSAYLPGSAPSSS